METIILAGGCFWGMQDLLRKLPGVVKTTVGYTGGDLEQPTYEHVKTGKTQHAEAVEVVFDTQLILVGELLDFFFRIHDPTISNRQGGDRGTQYRSAIFYRSEEQKQAAQEALSRAEASGRWSGPIVTEITPAQTFYPAENFHQDYLEKNPGGYTCHWIRD